MHLQADHSYGLLSRMGTPRHRVEMLDRALEVTHSPFRPRRSSTLHWKCTFTTSTPHFRLSTYPHSQQRIRHEHYCWQCVSLDSAFWVPLAHRNLCREPFQYDLISAFFYEVLMLTPLL